MSVSGHLSLGGGWFPTSDRSFNNPFIKRDESTKPITDSNNNT